jgi:hypothetical protein
MVERRIYCWRRDRLGMICLRDFLIELLEDGSSLLRLVAMLREWRTGKGLCLPGFSFGRIGMNADTVTVSNTKTSLLAPGVLAIVN